MNINRRNPFALLTTVVSMLVSIVMLSACGGSSTGSDSDQIAGIGGTGISYGTVTGFGSILVNGRRIDNSAASVTLDDNPGSGPNGGIKQGMVVTASGTFSGNTGTATSVTYRDNLEGEVCDAPATANGIRTLRVLGQTVILDATTIVDNGTIDTIALGDIVEVSGLPDENEEIRASFIEVKNPVPLEVEVKGRVDSVDNFAKTLTINALDVDFFGAAIDNNIPGGEPAVGQFVEVKGTVFGCGVVRDTLTANKVELEAEGAGNISTGTQTEIEGFVTTPLSADSFMIGSREVMINLSTRFLPEDFDKTDIQVGTKLEAEGTSANGVLSATKISFRRNVKLESDVDIVVGNTFTLVGFPGIIITTNSETTGVAPVGHIQVRGIEGPGNTVLATRIDDKSGDTEAFLQGPVDTKVGATITILGIPVDMNSISEFEGIDENMISRQQFLDLVQPGTLVKVEGDLNGSTIMYVEAELED
jgi:hypothetical protein